jgi:hypothetical protein
MQPDLRALEASVKLEGSKTLRLKGYQYFSAN